MSGTTPRNVFIYDFDLRASHARTLLPAALASAPFGFVLVRVRVRNGTKGSHDEDITSMSISRF